MPEMNLSRIILIISACAGLLSLPVAGHEKGFPEKTLKLAFPEAEGFTVKKRAISRSEAELVERMSGSKLQQNDLDLAVYIALGRDGATGRRRSLGMVLMLDANGPQGLIDMAVAFNTDKTVRKVIITKNENDKRIESAAFLDQFKGKGLSDALEPGKDLSFNGDLRAAREVARAVKRGLYLIDLVFKK